MSGWELWFWAEAALVAVCWIGEPEGSISEISSQVAWRVEGAPVEVVDEHVGFVGSFDINIDEACRLFQTALRASHDAIVLAVGIERDSCRHVAALRTSDLVATEI